MGLPINEDENIVVTCGSTEAMMAAMLAVCNPMDKVIVFSPFYENYGADAILSSAQPIYVELRSPQFTFDPDELRKAFKQRPKAIILCNPSNPTGRVFTRDELEYIASLAQEFDAFVITDEVMNTSSMNHTITSISLRYPVCLNGRYPAVPCRKHTPLRDGVWAMSLHHLKWLMPLKKYTTS
jgi:aspartate/methionine/tyrosine aminotransferase